MERTLSAREYFIMLKQADSRRCTVSKTLTCFTWGSTYWELNSFKGASHVAILEVEAESMEGHVSMPDFVQVEREVTDEKSYDSHKIAEELATAILGESLANSIESLDGSAGERLDPVAMTRNDSTVLERRVTEVLTKLERESVSLKSASKSAARAVAVTRAFSSAGEEHREAASSSSGGPASSLDARFEAAASPPGR